MKQRGKKGDSEDARRAASEANGGGRFPHMRDLISVNTVRSFRCFSEASAFITVRYYLIQTNRLLELKSNTHLRTMNKRKLEEIHRRAAKRHLDLNLVFEPQG